MTVTVIYKPKNFLITNIRSRNVLTVIVLIFISDQLRTDPLSILDLAPNPEEPIQLTKEPWRFLVTDVFLPFIGHTCDSLPMACR